MKDVIAVAVSITHAYYIILISFYYLGIQSPRINTLKIVMWNMWNTSMPKIFHMQIVEKINFMSVGLPDI